jgi:hypothetical protein
MAKAKRRTNPASFDHIRRACEEFRAANRNRGANAKRAVAVVAKIENSLVLECLKFHKGSVKGSDEVPFQASKRTKAQAK